MYVSAFNDWHIELMTISRESQNVDDGSILSQFSVDKTMFSKVENRNMNITEETPAELQ